MIGCLLAGWDEIVGIEQSAEYVEIGRQRLAYWTAMKERHGDDIDAILKAASRGTKEAADANPAQAELF